MMNKKTITSSKAPSVSLKKSDFKHLKISFSFIFTICIFLMHSCKDSGENATPKLENTTVKNKIAVQAAGIRKKVMHVNVCGKNCWTATHPDGTGIDTRGSTSRMVKVLTSIDNFEPHIVTFNEICYSQYRAIRSDMVSRGYAATYASTTTGGACDNFDSNWGEGFGNALFFKGTTSPPTATKFVLPNASGAEPRHLLYADVALDGKIIRVATTHLTLDATWRKKQLEFIKAKAAEWISQSRPVIITGDFNAIPTETNMGLMYSHSGGTGQFQECDEGHSCTAPLTFCRGGENTFSESRKLDYIFFSAVHFGGVDGDARSRYPYPISDHNFLQGSALWQ